MIIRKMGLVLEGGGMRGVFTSGVLDAFMKYDLYFNYVVRCRQVPAMVCRILAASRVGHGCRISTCS